jgi:hypothetical protein
MSRTNVVAHDPSVGDYAATSPFEWGGIFHHANSAPSYWM